MIKKRLTLKFYLSHLSMLAILLLIITACAPITIEPTPIPPSPTRIPPTATQVPPTATLEPTATVTQVPTEVVIPRPSPRDYISFAYDSESNQIILFGGQMAVDKVIANGETWAYDVSSNRWTQMNPASGPSVLTSNSLAYDSESDRVIMFSGAAGPMSTWGVSDTWAYDYNTNTWTKMTDGPKNHHGGRITYDAESDRIILFGGLSPNTFDYYDDTWTYDYNTDTWIDMQPKISPPGRNFQSITYDAKADRVLTWGGFDMDNKPVDESVWSYDFNTNTWQELKPEEAAYPLCRDYSSMAYDAESDRTILFGGLPQVTSKDFGTWAYDYNTNTWLEMNPVGDPGYIKKHHMMYIETIDRMLLFGGELCIKYCELSNDIWTYDFNSNTWENIIPSP